MLANLKSKKGFTLVEVIVVLVILAILAAILIPTLTGYIKKANEKRVLAEARAILVASQTIIDEKYASRELKGDDSVTIDSTNQKVNGSSSGVESKDIQAILKLADIAISDITFTVTFDFNTAGEISNFVYKTSDNLTATRTKSDGVLKLS